MIEDLERIELLVPADLPAGWQMPDPSPIHADRDSAEIDAALRYEQWVALHGAHRMEAFFDANPEYRSSEAWLVSGNGCSRASIWSDGVKLVDRMVPSNKPVRLPRRRRGIDWEFEIVTRTPVREVHLETSISDLTQLGLGVGNSV